MKLKNLILCATLSLISLGFWSCKKDDSNTNTGEIETTFELSGNDAVTENITEDANDILMETGVDNNFAGRNAGNVTIAETMNILSCATVTVTPLQGFPKNISIDFGNGCTSQNGVTRKGKIYVTVSDSLRKEGSVAVMKFDNYYVSEFKIEGKITWTNTSAPGTKSWQRKYEDGKITAVDGRYWLHTGIKEIVQVQGVNTPHNLLDDVFSITGHHTTTNAEGKTRTSTIIEPLQKKVICENVDKGKVKIEGASHTAVIDFGDGTCDRIATISIDGKTPRTILLR
ncbi:MAG: hypothetical protein ABIO55_05630 [Ginsengibacter sp.]